MCLPLDIALIFQRDPKNVLITDFFGSVRKVEITTDTISLQPDLEITESSYKKDRMDEELMEPLKYAEQLPVAQIIHQKPKLKDWHPPGGFILGLWALIIMVFFKNVRNQAYEVHFLDMMCEEDYMEDYHLG